MTKAADKKEEGQKYEFGCLMLLVKAAQIPHYAELLAAFKAEDLYESDIAGEFGIEYDPHVTVLFGFHDDAQEGYPSKIIKAARQLSTGGNVPLTLSGISNFHNPKFDVVKFDVQSPQLVKLNGGIAKRFEHTNEYTYKPHLTLAYVKSGKGPEYCEKLWKILGEKPVKLNGTKLMYSRPTGDKIITPL